MSWSVEAAFAAKIGFATHQNAIPVLRELAVKAGGDAAGRNLILSLSAEPPFVHPKTWRIDAMASGDELHVADRDVLLDATLLHDLTEAMTGALVLTLTSDNGITLVEQSYPVELLAHNQWGGLGTMAELLSAFVMPNDPAVDRVLKAASDVLRRAGKPDGLDGYQSGERGRTWETASAIWSSVAGLRLSYALPPVGFELVGQKVRTPSQIMDGRLATCLDTALLFAASLEQAGLNPILVLTQGHAFVGVWLQPMEFSALMTDEAAALRRRIDLDDLIVFETTLATHNPPGTFSLAMAAARRQIAEESETRFEMAIDVRRARMQKIRPLGVARQGQGSSDPNAPFAAEALEVAPALPSFDVEAAEAVPTAGGRIVQWQRRLLNLTTSNNLLNLRDSKTVVKLLCPDPGALEDMLAGGGRIRIVHMPDLEIGGRDATLYEQQTQTSLRAEVAEQAMRRGEALSPVTKEKLDASMVELYRKARADLEEGGANTLFLALGFLKWKKSGEEAKAYRAPLILLPVRLERKSALSGVTMIAHEDEPRFNLTLLELLRQDFELLIPGLEGDLPKDQSGIDVAGVWRAVRAAVRDVAGFEVVPEVALGTFSFAKYLMWKDLVDRADRLKESPLVRHLIDRDGSVQMGGGGFPRADELDAKVDPASLFTPLPADSSQLVAVVASAEGRNFVLDGPPGTGKSQTIANIIAHNLALGRRVLFVAEKKAALDVVQRRLADRGLAPFCLELHSSKATKSAVLKQLDSAWTTRDALTAEEWEREAAGTRRLRDELNGVVDLLHRHEPNGWTVHRAIGRTVRDADEATPKFAFPTTIAHSDAEMTRFREVVRRLGIVRRVVTDLPEQLDGVGRTEWSNGWQEEMVTCAAAVPAAIDAVQAAGDRLVALTRLQPRQAGPVDFHALLSIVTLCLDTHGRDMRFAFAPDLMEVVDTVRSAISLVARYRSEEHELSATYAPGAARRIDIDATRTAWMKASGRFWFLATLARRRVARALAETGGASGPVDPEADLPRLAAMRSLLEQVDELASVTSAVPGWAGLDTNADQVETVLTLAHELRAGIAAQARGPEALRELRSATEELVVDANEMLSDDGPVAGAAGHLDRALKVSDRTIERFATLSGAEASGDLDLLRSRADAVLRHARRLKDWTDWRRVRDEALQLCLGPLVDAIESGGVSPEKAIATFETAYARWFAFVRIDQEPLLVRFMAGEQEDRIARFQELDERMTELSSRYIRAKLCGLIPDKADLGGKDGYGALRHQLQLQRPSMPIRKLASEMGDAFTRLAPCMLMSPLSIAQYLPADQALFDLVIFDEASQITPWDAVGAMARGKQVIIAGDPRQMPPSNDFARNGGVATIEDDTAQDQESILDECLAAGVPQLSLDWHYRSRHESLITFSNTRYYGSKLVTFPPPVTRASAVSWQRVPGVYTSGARTNPIEAQAIVEEAVRRLRDPEFLDEKGQPLSLGIITMNAEQMRLVEDLLDKARRAFPEIEPHFDAETRLEPVCVRNLETVQGDERDVIFLGVNFGPTEPGGKTMSMAFGKLNASGGKRRLNVAATRARREMKVFTSFDPGMIDLTRTAAEGVRDLKAFIEFADRGPRALAEAVKGSLGGADSPFEEAVTAELRRRGWTVVPQVGVSKFRIDLGIVHPDRPGEYLVGVECDGASYHSAATARDRDKVRQAILEGLGWTLARIWSTDWWIDKQRAADRLHMHIEAVLAVDRAATAEREAAPASTASDLQSPVSATPDILPAAIAPHADSDQARREQVASAATSYESREPVSEPLLARFVQPNPHPFPEARFDTYRATDLSSVAALIEPARFYEQRYDAVLVTLIAQVLGAEAPIVEDLLVQRVARAHGFLRAGRVIRDRVMTAVERMHFVDSEKDGRRFVWTDVEQRSAWDRARAPATVEDVRLIEDIALAELRVAKEGRDAGEVARFFGVRRLSAAARERIEVA